MSAATLVVIPTYNEAQSIAELVVAVRAGLPVADVLIVDDASPDGTAAIVQSLMASDARVHLLERSAKLGLGSAYVAGLSWGLRREYQRFFQMDADFSHDPKYLPALARALEAGADVVVGSRNVPGGMVRGWGPLRHLLSKGGSLYARLVLGAAVRDMTAGFKLYSRRALELIAVASVQSNGYAFQVETTHRALRRGLTVVEIPIVFVDRRVGRSKMTRHDIAEAVTAVWSMRRFGREGSRRTAP